MDNAAGRGAAAAASAYCYGMVTTAVIGSEGSQAIKRNVRFSSA